jgi:multidrug efflux pump subunit AcrA (membrane-fusion protein)
MAMIRVLSIVLLLLTLSSGLAARDYAPLLTGEVFSRTAQNIFVPHTSRWRANISLMAQEGTEVNPGDVVVAFDGTSTLSELEQLREQQRALEAVADRDLARLDKELTQARFAVDQAETTLELATLKAEIPRGLIGAIEHSENQLAKQRGEKLLNDAIKQLAEKQQSLQARQQQADLDRQKFRLSESWSLEMLEKLSVEATQKGYVIHGNHPWTRAKFQEGDTVRTSFKVAEVADKDDLAIRVWVNAVDRPHIEANVPVKILFDALPETAVEGYLEYLSESATKRQEWGKAAYFEGTVSFDAEQISGLLPGMSAMVEFSR